MTRPSFLLWCVVDCCRAPVTDTTLPAGFHIKSQWEKELKNVCATLKKTNQHSDSVKERFMFSVIIERLKPTTCWSVFQHRPTSCLGLIGSDWRRKSWKRVKTNILLDFSVASEILQSYFYIWKSFRWRSFRFLFSKITDCSWSLKRITNCNLKVFTSEVSFSKLLHLKLIINAEINEDVLFHCVRINLEQPQSSWTDDTREKCICWDYFHLRINPHVVP